MILGSTYKQQYDIRQEKLKSLYGIKPWFAWYPVQENNGRWVWLRTVYRDLGISRVNSSGNYVCKKYPDHHSYSYTAINASVTYYLENYEDTP